MVSLTPIPWLESLGRLLLAIGLGAAIGWDREYDNKPAGLRTNMLVSLGAALFILVPLQSGLAQQDTNTIARSLDGIITGVGFVGAGSILREQRVRGLTSAAAIWISAAVGVAAGIGLWPLSLMGTLLAIVILRILKWLERRLSPRKRKSHRPSQQ